MTSEGRHTVESLFRAALALPADDRPSFLARECGDASLRAEVLDLIDQDILASREGFLATPDYPAPRRADSAAAEPARYVVVNLIRGAGASPAVELQGLLLGRIRGAVAIMLVGFLIFFLLDVAQDLLGDGELRPILWAHLAVVLATAAGAAILWGHWPLTLAGLRRLELILVVIGSAFFSLFHVGQFLEVSWSSLDERMRADVLDLVSESCALRWFVAIIFYGLFIPNTWRRCALVVVGIALCPLALTVGIGVRAGMLGPMVVPILAMAIWLGLALAAAIYGTSKITELRRRAFEARKLGPYSLVQPPLGSGGMGEVYLAEHALLRRPCAVKVIRPERAGDRATIARFEREVQATASLTHPNTIRIFDYGVADDGTFYYTMEYLPGLTLQAMVRDHGPLPPARAVDFLRQVCSALREAHGKGLIHRDIKPSNLMACRPGGLPDVIKILDFGLVQSDHPEGPSGDPGARAYVAGTPDYLSPEQADGREEIDARSDIYSLGAVGHFLLSGRPPFVKSTAIEVLVAHMAEPVPPIRIEGGTIPPDLEAVILRCLAKEPADRFPSAESLERALSACRCAGEWSVSMADRWWQDHPVSDRASGPAS